MFLNRCMSSASHFVLIKQHSITFMSNHMCWNIYVCMYWHICRTTCNNLFMIKLNYLINGSNFKSVPGGNSPDGELPRWGNPKCAISLTSRRQNGPVPYMNTYRLCCVCLIDAWWRTPIPCALLPPHPCFKCLLPLYQKRGLKRERGRGYFIFMIF